MRVLGVRAPPPRTRVPLWGGACLGCRAEWKESFNSVFPAAEALWIQVSSRHI